MKHEKWLAGLTGAILSMILAYGAVGSVVTAFDLSAVNMAVLALTCVICSIFCAICFTVKRGSLILLGALALVVGFLWRRGNVLPLTFSLIRQISKFYDSAYGWGIFPYGSAAAPVDTPMGIIGCFIALAVSWTVCRQQSLWPAAAAVLLPICACLVVTDTVPDARYLYLVLLGFLILVMTNTVRRKNVAQGVTLTGIVSVPLTLALGLLFWLAPQESYVNRAPDYQQQATDLFYRIPEVWEEITQQQTVEAEKDRTEKVELDNIGPRPDLHYEVMKVFGTAKGTLYLRGQDFSIYSGTGWTAGQQPAETFPGNTDILVAAGAVTIETKRVRNVLYLPYYPMEAGNLSGCFYNTDNIKRYVFTRGILPEGWQELSYSTAGAAQEAVNRDAARKNYLYLPESTRQWAGKITDTLINSGMSRTEMANAIAIFVRNSAGYDLNTQKMPAGNSDFAQWFLTESDTGYCVHFATAAAVLLRAADIPARYVTGYMTQVESGKTVTVTAADAHAWVEYYEPVLDMWLVLEATPASSAPDATQSATQQTVPQAGTSPSTMPTQNSEEPTDAPTQPSEPDDPPSGSFLWLGWISVLAALIGAVPAQRKLRLWLRQRQRQSAVPNQLALLLWRDVTLHAKLLGKKAPRTLERLAQKAKFSQHILTQEELDQLRNYIEEAQTQLKSRPWYWQLWLKYVLIIY